MADTPEPPGPPGPFARIIDEQLELAAARLPALVPAAVHPSPEDHDELQAAHPDIEDLLLGRAQPTPEMIEELAALEAAPVDEQELERQALAEGCSSPDAEEEA
jgi:hypothetical protein